MKPNARLLLIDDDPILARSSAHALRAAGYEVDVAYSAGQGLRLAEGMRPDLVLVDVVLPDGNGVEVCRKIKEQSSTAGVFVVLISGFQTTAGHQVAGLEAGADAYIVRPIENRELVARIQALLRLHQAQAQLRQARQELEQRVAERTAELSGANERLTAEIAERRNLEARYLQAQKLEAVGQLAAGLAHDFNNILTIVTCNASLMLLDPRLPADLRPCLNSITLATERGADLIRRLLLFTRRQVLQRRVLDVNQCLERLRNILGSALGQPIAVEYRLGPALPPILADAGMIEQAILNLAVNARDAMPHGGRLTIETRAVDCGPEEVARVAGGVPGVHLCLTVADTGYGMDAQVKARVFEAFFTTKEAGKGSGLGLATVQSIVQQHQGWIDVESEPGAGTTFRIFLPVAVGAAAVPTVEADSPALHGGTETILLAEDEPAVRELARTILERKGYRVLEAASGVAALELWRVRQAEVDLLLSDVVMPADMGGWELAARLKIDKPSLKVILMTGYGSESVGPDWVVPADFRVLLKPFDPDGLASAVRSCLDG